MRALVLLSIFVVGLLYGALYTGAIPLEKIETSFLSQVRFELRTEPELVRCIHLSELIEAKLQDTDAVLTSSNRIDPKEVNIKALVNLRDIFANRRMAFGGANPLVPYLSECIEILRANGAQEKETELAEKQTVSEVEPASDHHLTNNQQAENVPLRELEKQNILLIEENRRLKESELELRNSIELLEKSSRLNEAPHANSHESSQNQQSDNEAFKELEKQSNLLMEENQRLKDSELELRKANQLLENNLRLHRAVIKEEQMKAQEAENRMKQQYEVSESDQSSKLKACEEENMVKVKEVESQLMEKSKLLDECELKVKGKSDKIIEMSERLEKTEKDLENKNAHLNELHSNLDAKIKELDELKSKSKGDKDRSDRTEASLRQRISQLEKSENELKGNLQCCNNHHDKIVEMIGYCPVSNPQPVINFMPFQG